MCQKLFSDFESSDKQIWLRQVEKDRPHKEYKDVLWPVSEKLFLEPYYDKSDVNELLVSDLQKCQKADGGWLNQALINYTNSEITNFEIDEAVLGGADALWVSIGDHSLDEAQLTQLLYKTTELAVPVVFECSSGFSSQLLKEISSYTVKGGLAFDPLSAWMRGEITLEECYSSLELVMEYWPDTNGFRPVMVGGHAFHNSGANVVQELAFTISLFVEYLDWFTENNIPVEQVIDSLFISVSVGIQYLTEIGKLRALRALHKRVCDAYGIPGKPAFIHASTSSFYETTASPNTNFIRTTVEAMAAVAGSCDALTVLPNFSAGNRSRDFSARIARNVNIVMEEEALLGKVADPSAGSYLVDKLTLELINSSWELFLETEKKGGLVAAFKQSFIQEAVQHSWESKIESYNNGCVLVGVNKFIDKEEPAKSVVFSETFIPINEGIGFLKPKKLEEGINSSRS